MNGIEGQSIIAININKSMKNIQHFEQVFDYRFESFVS